MQLRELDMTVIRMRMAPEPKKIKNRMLKPLQCPRCKDKSVVFWDVHSGMKQYVCDHWPVHCDYEKLVRP
jgi:transcription elongation factor Elf1